jgi:hypothetical protein
MVRERVAKKAVHFTVDKEAEKVRKGLQGRCDLGRHTPSNLLPPSRLHFLKFSELPKIAPDAGDQVFNAQACEGCFILKL